MLYFENLKCFFRSKRLAIKSCCFLSILLLVFVSAIIMINNDYTQDASCTNTINTATNIKTYNSEDENKDSSKDAEALNTSVSKYHY